MSKGFINSLFGFSIIIITVLSGFTFYTFSKLNEYNNKVDNTNKALYDLKMIEREFLVMVASQRSFLITKDSIYTYYYNRSLKSLNTQIGDLKIKLEDNKSQVLNLDSLLIYVNDRHIAFKNETYIESKDSISREEKNFYIRTNLPFSQKVLHILNRLSIAEYSLLNKRLLEHNNKETSVPNMLLMLITSTFILLGYTFYMLNKELNARKKMVFNLETVVKQLNESNNELEQYAYIASHDLQEPLRKIRIYNERLMSLIGFSNSEPEKIITYIERIDKSSERMSNLIRDLLEYSKYKNQIKNKEKVDIIQLFSSKASEILDETNIVHQLDFDKNEVPLIDCMPSQMSRLIHNLIGNSVKYRDLGKEVLILKLKYEYIPEIVEGTGFHVFVFQDNGIGFDNKYVEQIFKPFKRLVNKESIDGTGIGLSICRQIMLNHRGNIEAFGTPGEGVRFKIYFPI